MRLPHDAMIGEPRFAEAASGKNAGWFDGRDYEYRKVFTAPDGAVDGTVVLELEGVYRNAEVWLDGTRLAFRPYGYTGFTVDLTGRLQAGREHDLRVVARNSDQPNSRWYSGAGIYRPVTLWVGEWAHVPLDGLRVTTLSIDPPRVAVAVETSAPGTLTVEILDAVGPGELLHAETGSTDGHLELEVPLLGAGTWSPESPQLYVCRVRLTRDGRVDEAETTFGIRTLAWGDDGFLLNGKRTILQGACVHHDNGVLGARAYADAEERKIRLMKETGYNAVRSAHNPCSKALLDACDRLGVLVMDEYIDHWYVHKTQHDYVEHFDEWWRLDLEDMVRKDVNHPSVIMYSIGNEVGETAEPRGIALTREMTEQLHALDPTRPVTCGINIFFNFLRSIGLGVYSDKKAAREARSTTRRKRRAVGSEFFNTMAGVVGADFMKRGATLHPCDVKTRGAFAALDVAGYNYGILRYERDLKKYPHRLILGTETFCSDAYRFREAAKKNPRLIGDFVWAGMDYLGEVGVGAWEYADYAPAFDGFGWLTAGSGRVDLTGRLLGEALYTRVALEQEAGPLLAVRPVNHSGEKHSPSAWKMSDALDSWSWTGCEGRPAQVEVYARAFAVELLVNGRSVGRRRLQDDCVARFTTPWEPGTVEAVAYDEHGRETGRHALRSADATTELRAEPERDSVEPGGLSFVRLRYADPKGIGKPLERGLLTVDVAGGTLLGLGSAAPFNPESFTGTTTDTYYGEALAVVQAGPSGTVEVAVDDGIRHGRAVVEVRP
ncbi:glycoside hydrolase family 2 TIM barrel-domain containing protein [Cellulomonas endometrii]|uniref:glycoside hydrolase family 2 TIM barrel-domain containing protein n=1 Tax=Cellulomonas endometrii TaxID=3036301 RepID=UPI0024ACC3D6|nr:glycoside hydrolase family 2 TIM barrel-domain containing protein [Cellulomonas endometrii]